MTTGSKFNVQGSRNGNNQLSINNEQDLKTGWFEDDHLILSLRFCHILWVFHNSELWTLNSELAGDLGVTKAVKAGQIIERNCSPIERLLRYRSQRLGSKFKVQSSRIGN